jgi:hypothetical protein
MRRVVDVLKTIIVLDDEATLVSVARFIMSRWRVVRMNNTFRSPAFTGQRDLTLNVAIPLPSASVLRKESKKKFHIVEINLQLSGFLNLKEEAHVPYLYFKDLSDLRFLGPSVSSFFDDMEDGENIADYLQRIIKSDNWSALENLDDMVGIRMMADWEVKIRTSRRLVELAEGHHSETTLLGRAHEFANACENMNMESDAIAIYEKVIQARDRIFGDKDRDIMLAVDRMAGMYRSKGELDTALDMYQDAVKKLQAVMKDERRDFATKLEQCKLEGEKNLERLKLEDEKNLASALEEARKSEEASLEKAKKRSDANVVLLKTGLEARLKDEVARVREGGEMKLEDALRELDDRLHKEKEAKIAELKEEKERELEALRATKAKELESREKELEEGYSGAMKELRNQHRLEQEETLKKLEGDLKASHEGLVAELNNKHETALQSVLNQDEQTLATVRSALREELTALHEFAIESLKKEHAIVIESERKAMQETFDEKERTLLEEMEKFVNDLTKVKGEIEEMQESHEQSMNSVKTESGKELELLKTSHEAALSDVKSLTSKIETLEAQLEDVKKQKETSVHRLGEQHSKEIEM